MCIAFSALGCKFGAFVTDWCVIFACFQQGWKRKGDRKKRKEKKEKERRGKKNARDEGKMTQKKEKKVEEGEKPRGIAKSPISSRFFFYSLTKREAARCLFPAPPPPFTRGVVG